MEIVASEDIKTWPPSYLGTLHGSVTLQDGISWENVRFTKGTAHFVEKPESELIDTVCKFSIPKDSRENLRQVHLLRRKLWVVRITDHNGAVKFIGTKEDGAAVLLDTRDHGQNKRDRNQYVLSIQRKHKDVSVIDVV